MKKNKNISSENTIQNNRIKSGSEEKKHPDISLEADFKSPDIDKSNKIQDNFTENEKLIKRPENKIENDKFFEFKEAEYERMKIFYSDMIRKMNEVFNGISESAYLSVSDDISYIALRIMDEIKNPYFQYFLRYLTPGNYLISHSLNVAYLSGVVSKMLNIDEKQVIRNIISALCIDLGMTLYRSLYEEERKFSATDRQIIKNHVKEGAQIVEKVFAFDVELKNYVYDVVLNSHERYDGSGYFSKKGEELSLSVQIISMCDFYEALTHQRPWREAYSEAETVDMMSSIYRDFFSPRVFKFFVSAFGIFPAGSVVRLSTGEIAEVFSVNKNKILRPVVKVIADSSFSPLSPYFIDLMEFPLTSIENYIKIDEVRRNNPELASNIYVERLWIEW